MSFVCISNTRIRCTCLVVALAAQIRKHRVNDERCRELRWVCTPLVVETYGCWGTEAIQALLRLAVHSAGTSQVTRVQ